MEAPICLIQSTKDGKLKVNAGAVEILSQITQPVTVVSIVGACRTGKSFLMNRLAGQQKGFDLGHTVQTKTKGIWMWCRPHPVKKDHVLVLLDTEGLGDVEQCNSEQDTWIFSLAALLSDVLVYNSSWTINQDAINKLHFIKDITEFIKVKAKDNNDPETCVSNHFPEFIWALRDFVLKLEIDGKAVTQDDYLEHALKPQLPETTKRIKKTNKYKNKLSACFKIRKCFTFEHPTCEKSVLQRLEDVHDDELTPSFIAKSKEFCDYIFRKDPIKYKGGLQPINGKRFGLMTVKYTESISSSNFICMENVIMNVSKTQNKTAVQEATKYYEDKMKGRIIFPTKSTEDFMTVSEKCEKEALQIFIDKSFQDEKQKFQEEFAKNVKQIKDEFSEQNIAASRRLCEETITALSGDLDKNLNDGSYVVPGGYQKYQEIIEEIKEKYNKIPNKGVQV
uniref:GB1/RHD3-type G domain-containing protein n=1 Tax=Leptobrachium leishanense TaxID=445787 RepID=A0A8C5WIP4_9ANUR